MVVAGYLTSSFDLQHFQFATVDRSLHNLAARMDFDRRFPGQGIETVGHQAAQCLGYTALRRCILWCLQLAKIVIRLVQHREDLVFEAVADLDWLQLLQHFSAHLVKALEALTALWALINVGTDTHDFDPGAEYLQKKRSICQY